MFWKKYDYKKLSGFLAVYCMILLDSGGFYRRSTYLLALISLSVLIFYGKYGNYLIIERRKFLYGSVCIFLSGLISSLLGIDTGESIYGMIKLATVFLLIFWFWQIEEEQKENLWKTLPVTGVILIVFSGFFSLMPVKQDWISSTGRLAGPFAYPNAMALFLLIGIIVTENLLGKKRRWLELFLCIGVLMTGSRTAFFFLCCFLLYYFLKYHGTNKNLILGFLCLTVTVAAAFALMGAEPFGIGRFLSFRLHSSTFQGRLLYWEDACRMLLKYPLGLGYMGYFYLQQKMQTGVYSVRFVHNEWLQSMLDYGIPAGIGIWVYLIRQLRVCKEHWKKELLCLIAAYSFFDFPLQFWGILLILLLLLQPVASRQIICDKRMVWKLISGLLFFMFAICALVSGMARFWAMQEEYENAACWNPFSTEYRTELLLHADDLESAVIYADQALAHNKLLYSAYKVKANAAAEEGNIESFLENEKNVLEMRKYKIEEYETYFRILYSLYSKAAQKNDLSSVKQCIEEMEKIPETIAQVKKETSVRAYRIREKPALYWKKEYELITQSLKGENE